MLMQVMRWLDSIVRSCEIQSAGSCDLKQSGKIREWKSVDERNLCHT